MPRPSDTCPALSVNNTFSRRLEICIIAGVLACFALLPSLPDIPLCPYAWITGKPCPTCGTTRSLWNLAHGRFAASLAFNPIGYIVAFALLRRLAVLLLPNSRAIRFIDGHGVNVVLLALYLVIGFVHFYSGSVCK
ncbi:MAG: DUF2752 domain-containing protein [Planctomycetota bacterium]